MAFSPVVEGSFAVMMLRPSSMALIVRFTPMQEGVFIKIRRKTLPLLLFLTSMPPTNHCSLSALYHTINLLQNPAPLGSVPLAGFLSQMFQTCDATCFLCVKLKPFHCSAVRARARPVAHIGLIRHSARLVWYHVIWVINPTGRGSGLRPLNRTDSRGEGGARSCTVSPPDVT